MADLLIRDVPADVVERLKDQARENGRSLQKELLAIVEDAVGFSIEEWLERVAGHREERRAWGITTDSVDLIREDRDNR
jgi:plasmid stability protein